MFPIERILCELNKIMPLHKTCCTCSVHRSEWDNFIKSGGWHTKRNIWHKAMVHNCNSFLAFFYTMIGLLYCNIHQDCLLTVQKGILVKMWRKKMFISCKYLNFDIFSSKQEQELVRIDVKIWTSFFTNILVWMTRFDTLGVKRE